MITLGFGLALNAQAYVPQARYILHTFAKKHLGFTAIQVRSSVTAIEDGKPTALHFLEVTRFEAATASLKSWVLDDAGNLLYMADQKAASLPASAALFFEDSSLQMSQALARIGVSIRKYEEPSPAAAANAALGIVAPEPSDGTILKRWNKKIAWVMGSSQASSLWVEKDTFLPLRLVGLAGETQATQFDLQWDDYRYFQDFTYPRTTLLYLGAQSPYLRAELTEVNFEGYEPQGKARRQKQKPAAELPLLKFTTPGFTDLGNAALPALRAMIETYYQVIR